MAIRQKAPSVAVGKPKKTQAAKGEMVQYDPKVQALIQQAQQDMGGELQDLQRDSGLPRINLKNAADEFEVAILNHQKANAYWEAGFKPGETAGPDCASDDGVTGNGKRFVDGKWEEGAQACDTCAMNQFGSKGDSTRGKKCRNMRVLFVQDLEDTAPNPQLLVIPPTGLKSAATYLRAFIQDGIPKFTVATKVYKVDDGRTPLGSFAFERGAPLTSAQMHLVAPLYASLSKLKASAAQMRADDVGSAAEFSY